MTDRAGIVHYDDWSGFCDRCLRRGGYGSSGWRLSGGKTRLLDGHLTRRQCQNGNGNTQGTILLKLTVGNESLGVFGDQHTDPGIIVFQHETVGVQDGSILRLNEGHGCGGLLNLNIFKVKARSMDSINQQ